LEKQLDHHVIYRLGVLGVQVVLQTEGQEGVEILDLVMGLERQEM
jgi:hypothetical protein